MIFDWYYDQGWADGSALGRLRFELLRSAGFFHSAYLMRNFMPEDQFSRVMNAYNWYTMFGRVYETPVEKGASADQLRTLLIPKLMYAISMKDDLKQATALQSFARYANNALSPAPGFLDCIKPDYSGYHHRGPYFNAYYPDALYAGSLTFYFLSKTPYKLSEETFIHLKNALLTFGFLCAGYDTPGAITGRFPTQTETLDQILPAFAYLALSRETPDPELAAFFKRMWKPTEEPMKSLISKARTDIAFKSTAGEVEKMLELSESTIFAGVNPVGAKYMPYSGLLISRRPDWVLTAKGLSKYIWDFESSSTENLYGRYLSYGHVEISRLSQKMKSFQPANVDWNWSHIPGTTSKYLTKTELNSQNYPTLQRNFSDEPFLGGLAFDRNVSIFANILHDNTFDTGFYARKSVFQFDSIYTCLGSGIKNSDRNYFVHTTLFQNLKISSNDVVEVNGTNMNTTATALINPVLKDNYGNAYIVKDGTVNLDFTTSFISGYINHGRVLTVGKYAYQIVTGVSDNDLVKIASTENTPVQIIRNDEAVQIVYQQATKTTAAVIYDADNVINNGKLYSVNIPSIVVFQEQNDTLELAFTDPDMHRPSAGNISALSSSAISADGEFSFIRIELNGLYNKMSTDNDVSVNTNGMGKTIIEYPKAKDGQTYRVLLKLISTGVQKPLSSELHKPFQVVNRGLNRCRVEYKTNDFFSYRIFDVAGKLISDKKNIISSVDLDMGKFPSGIYYLHLKSHNEEQFVKLLR